MKNKIILQSFDDLHQDFEEQLYLISSAINKLENFKKEVKRAKKYIQTKTFELVSSKIKNAEADFSRLRQYTVGLAKQAQTDNFSIDLLEKLAKEKSANFDLIRAQYNFLGTLITSTDWQSPSYSHSLFSNAGRQTGKIIGTINDYKRDTHLDEVDFEKKFLKEYVNARFKFNLHAYLTNSGMAAFTTILDFLIMEGKIKGKILIGANAYFQYKQLLLRNFTDRIIEVEETRTEKIIQIITQEKPGAIFFDSLCNAYSLPLPDLKTIIQFLIKNTERETYLIIDNTCLSTAFQLFKTAQNKPGKLHLILFESLNKFYQFGLDRVTGGIIVVSGNDAGKIFEYRKHSGTNITDSSVYSLPTPNRKLLEKRLARHERNTSLLANYLQDYISQKKNSVIEKIIYPGLPDHPSFPSSRNLFFQGSSFNIQFKEKWQKVKHMKRFIEIIINEAKKEKVGLVAGTSFGLNTTRVYLTSLWTKYGKPFLRISTGTENLRQMKKIESVFIKTLEELPKFSVSGFGLFQT